MFPILAKEYGIPVLGETSGGGECNLVMYFCTNGLVGYLSGPLKYSVPSGAVVDYGAEPDYPLVKTDKDGCMEADAYRGGYYLKKNGAWDGKAKAEGWKLSTGGYWNALKAVNYLRDGWANSARTAFSAKSPARTRCSLSPTRR